MRGRWKQVRTKGRIDSGGNLKEGFGKGAFWGWRLVHLLCRPGEEAGRIGGIPGGWEKREGGRSSLASVANPGLSVDGDAG